MTTDINNPPIDNLWTEPESAANTDYQPIYPYNNVIQTLLWLVYLPQRCLFSAAVIVADFSVSHGIPTRLVLPMVITT